MLSCLASVKDTLSNLICREFRISYCWFPDFKPHLTTPKASVVGGHTMTMILWRQRAHQWQKNQLALRFSVHMFTHWSSIKHFKFPFSFQLDNSTPLAVGPWSAIKTVTWSSQMAAMSSVTPCKTMTLGVVSMSKHGCSPWLTVQPITTWNGLAGKRRECQWITCFRVTKPRKRKRNRAPMLNGLIFCQSCRWAWQELCTCWRFPAKDIVETMFPRMGWPIRNCRNSYPWSCVTWLMRKPRTPTSWWHSCQDKWGDLMWKSSFFALTRCYCELWTQLQFYRFVQGICQWMVVFWLLTWSWSLSMQVHPQGCGPIASVLRKFAKTYCASFGIHQ